MIALDTNVLVRFLVRDDEAQAASARNLVSSFTVDKPGFVCREVILELVWVLERAYGFSREQIADVMEHLVSTDVLVVEAGADVARTAFSYGTGSPGFSDLMILAAAERSNALPLHTFDRKAARQEGVTLVSCSKA
ncbi:MAG: type II toxin-antitoxin system VapC family toxin [Gemmatimonadota bacterium]|nr:type II toxin-antitoxin system VapC family toxin [Gemmatimonadota bacterium]